MENYQKERNRKIFEERKTGATYREIGAKYGLSVEVVRRICVQQERFKREGKENDSVELRRAKNAIWRQDIKDPCLYSDEELLKVRGVGLETLKVLREAYGPYKGE